MPAQALGSRTFSNRSTLQIVCAAGAALVGFVLLAYAVYFVPNRMGDSVSDLVAFLVFVAIIGLLSLVGALGYWLGKTWGWYIQFTSALGQLLLPGSLFEFKPDLYHLMGWITPVVSLVIVIRMGLEIRRKRGR